ncbi:MAG: aminotransferase class V-fold PLP-dependent enzyme [Clostridiales bacterium]|nr:aminotransferase class V-fold PLP-dependent enzyme [Clostridiales bacterium]
MIYLDYAADTPADKEVLAVFTAAAQEFFANANSAHALGMKSLKAFNDALLSIKSHFFGADGYEIIAAASASEANNLAIKGVAEAYRGMGRHIISTVSEHLSVGGALTYLQAKGWEVELVRIGRDGKVDLEHLSSLMRKDTVLVTVCTADSELGAVQPVESIAGIIRAYPNCRFHTDATQVVGKTAVPALDGIHALTFAPHKFYGLNGMAFLLKERKTVLTPLIHGGGLSVYRGGTPSAALAVAAEKAVSLAFDNLNARYDRVAKLRAVLTGALSALPYVKINSPAGGIPHILNFSVDGVNGETLRAALSEDGVCVSVKSACSSPNTPSKTVYAVTGDKRRALSSIRVSLSHLTTEEEIRIFTEKLQSVISLLKS